MERQVAKYKSNEIGAFIDEIQPQVAKYIFENKNPNNRKLIASTALSYKRQMLEGKWAFNSHTIGFDINGNLTDGQHRLYACWKSNVPLKVIVVVGLPCESFETTDIGKIRSYKDVLSASKMTTNETIVSEMAKKAFYFLKGSPTEHGSSSTRKNCANNSELMEFYKQHSDLFEELVPYVKKWAKADRMKLFKRAEMSGIASSLIILGIEKEKVIEFFDLLTSDNYSSNAAICATRRRFEQVKAKNLYVKPLERYNYYKCGWKNFYNNKPITKLRSVTEYTNNWV